MKDTIEIILAKYFAGEANSSETDFVNNWKTENNVAFDSFSKAYHANIFYSKPFSVTESKKQRIIEKVTPNDVQQQNRRYIGVVVRRIAAIFIGLLVIASALWYNNSLNHTINNYEKQISVVQLPDGSTIQLNLGSTIKYKESWFSGFNRKVYLNGKAYFTVSKNPDNPFTVHTTQLDVTVLGTQFTVNQIGDQTQFLLSEGKVLLEGAAFENNMLLDKSGQQIIIKGDAIVKNNMVNNNLYSSWTKNKIYFNDCTVKDVLTMLQDSYNINTAVNNPEYLNKKLFGSTPCDDPTLIIKALSHILGTDIKIIDN